MAETHRFTATIKLFEDNNLWFYHFLVPDEVSQQLLASETGRRVLCSIDGTTPIHCSLMPDGLGSWFINVNKALREKLGWQENQERKVTLQPDTSEFGMPMPEELKEALLQDPAAKSIFDNLTPGKQRNLIYIVNQVKSPSIRLRRALVITNHLVTHNKIDFKALHQELKNANQANR